MAVQAFNTDVTDPTPTSRGEIIQAAALLNTFAAGTYTLTVPKGCRVTDVVVWVGEAFNGTAPTIKIGDGDDDDGYFTSANIAPATAATVTAPAIRHSSNGAVTNANTTAAAFLGGKYYPDGDTIDVIYAFTTQGTTGKLFINVYGLIQPRMGVPAGITNAAVL